MSCMFCESKAEAVQLETESIRRVPVILKEFSEYFNSGDQVGITVKKIWHGLFWSVGADLTFGKEIVKSYEAFDLLEMDLLNMELNAIIKKGEG